ncbi:MAG: two-component system response regulator [Chitinophagales bacterium]
MDERAANLLIAEDDPQSAHLLIEMLTAAGYRCQVASDGDTTIKTALSALPDLVLLDVRIPGRNGFEVCEELRAAPATAHVPIVMVTACAEEQYQLRAMDAGADDFLTKPVKRSELYARVRSLLRLRRCAQEREAPAAVVESFFRLISFHDAELARHSRGVAALAATAARSAGLEAEEVILLERAGLLHDLGKVAVPPGPEAHAGPAESLEAHAERGAEVLSCLGGLSRLAPLLRRHHERWDQGGLARAAGETAQPLAVQLLAAANAWEHTLQAAPSLAAAAAGLEEQVQQGWWNPALLDPLLQAARETGQSEA